MSRKKLHKIGSVVGISDRIVELRKKLKLTQDGFGKLLKVQKSTISRYESGTIPGDENLRKIAQIGNTTIEWLLRGDQPSAPQLLEKNPENYGDSPEQPLDVVLLAEILAETKQVIADKHVKLSPKREARWIALVYDHCREGKVKPDRILVERCLWITRIN
jgi:transcriptional regulator with XRE-family HTH domain